MPSGPEGFVSEPTYSEELGRAKELLLAHRRRWRIVYHYDGDGIASASSLVRALLRLDYPVHATPLLAVERPRMEELLKATAGPLLVVDTGANWPGLFAEHAHPVIVLDHHPYSGAPKAPALPAHVAFVNPLDWGVDGMHGLCAATLAWLFTLFLDARNWDNAPWGLSGAIADRQHVGGWTGLNARLVEGALARSLVAKHRGLLLVGATLEDALRQSIDPYVRGLSDRPEACRAFLQGLDLDPARTPGALTDDERERLTRAVVTRLTIEQRRPEVLATVGGERWYLPALGVDAEELSNLQNASGRAGTPGVGVALALGDPGALAHARAAEERWRSGILRGLRRVEDEGVNPMSALEWFESPDTPLAGTQAGFAVNYLLEGNRPVFVFSPSDRSLKVSARATPALVGRGLDLAVVCRDAAGVVGGEGGGHPIASGATIPSETRDAFLAEADRQVAFQLGGLPGAVP